MADYQKKQKKKPKKTKMQLAAESSRESLGGGEKSDMRNIEHMIKELQKVQNNSPFNKHWTPEDAERENKRHRERQEEWKQKHDRKKSGEKAAKRMKKFKRDRKKKMEEKAEELW